ncbi:MAG: hypothetical protein U5K51_08495 [Flavobacteriaceae bacterium]|nr:hypothetical protein [Flavobacteriaceae bacterium]
MKNKLFYIAILLFTLMACSDSFTETPAGWCSSDEALQNATGIELKLIGAYSVLDGIRNNQGSG